MYRLKFSDAIVPTVKDPISVKVLTKRLSKLSEELSNIDQDHVDLDSLTEITKSLINKKLLKHNDHGVQSLVALCLADILRLYAPDAPYTATQLTDIFKLFLKIFKHLAAPSDTAPHYQENFDLVAKLAEVRSIILITDLPKADQLIEALFNLCYNDLGKLKNLSPRLLPLIADILSEIFAELDTIPQSVLKLILNKFLSNAAAPKAVSDASATSAAPAASASAVTSTLMGAVTVTNPGFAFTVAICESNPVRMARQIAQFFSEILYENSSAKRNNRGGSVNSDDEDEDEADAARIKRNSIFQLDEVALKNLQKVHKLVEEIWKYVPDILSSVIGLINSELFADNEKIRILATETIGNIVRFQPSKLNFISTHQETWQNWAKKILDSSTLVRIKWVQIATEILNSRFELIGEISSGIVKSLIDTDEKVRHAAVKSVGNNLKSLLFLGKFANNLTIMNTLGQLARERNKEIRTEAIKLLSNIYDSKFNELLEEEHVLQELEEQQHANEEAENEEENEEASSDNVNTTDKNKKNNSNTTTASLQKLISWIPDHIISLIYINDKSINYLIDKQLIEKIFSLDSNTEYRVKRLLHIVASLSDKSKTAFWAINKRQIQLASGLLQFLKLVTLYHSPGDDNSKASVEEKLIKAINWLCATIPDELNPFNVLVRFVKLDNKRFVHLIKLCTSSNSDFDTIKNSFKEFFNKLKDSKVINNVDPRGTGNSSRHDNNDDAIWSSGANIVSANEMYEVWKLIMYRSAIIYYNKSNVVSLVQFTKNESSEFYKISAELIEQISTTLPKVFDSHIDELVSLVIKSAENNDGANLAESTTIFDSDNDDTNTTVTTTTNTTAIESRTANDNRKSIIATSVTNNFENLINTLRTIYHFFIKYPKYLPQDNVNFANALISISTDGTPLEAKFAIKLLCIFNEFDAEEHLQKILHAILPLDVKNFKFSTHLSIISELFLYKPNLIEDSASDITSYLIKEVLLTNHTLATEEEKQNPETAPHWITEEQLELGNYDHCYAKMLTLRIFVNRLKALDTSPENIDSTELANLVLKLLISCIGNGGELVNSSSPTYPTPRSFQARLRLTAGLMLLKLSKLPTYNKMLKPSTISRLVYLIQDENIEIRKSFVKYLQDYLNDELISQRYLPLIFFMAHEPDLALRKSVKTWISSSFNSQLARAMAEDIGFEKAYVRLLHMIAHHQEFIDLINQAYKVDEEQTMTKDEKAAVDSDNDSDGNENHNEQTATNININIDRDNQLFKAYAFAVKYILFYLESIVTKDNISLLFYFSNRIKQYRDALISDIDYELAAAAELETETEPKEPGAESTPKSAKTQRPAYIDNIYRVAELSLLSIKIYRERKNWIIQTFPGKLQLSKDLFAPMKSTREAQKVASRTYIPDKLAKKLETLIKSEIGIGSGSNGHGLRSNRGKKRNGSGHGNAGSGGNGGKNNGFKKFKRSTKPKQRLDGKNNNEKKYTSVRRSSRVKKEVNYADSDDEDEDLEKDQDNYRGLMAENGSDDERDDDVLSTTGLGF